MSLIFQDSFDHYTTITDKWDSAGTDCTIRNTGVARTGIGCLQINSASFGPSKTFGHVTDLLVATAWYSDIQGLALLINNVDADVGFNACCLQLRVDLARSVSVLTGPSRGQAVLGTSAAGLVNFNQYNSLALRATIAVSATVTAYVNGVLVLTLTGVNTTNLGNASLHYANGVTLMGPGAIPTCYHDDVYVLDCSTGDNAAYLGPLKIYASPPTADGAVAWTPSTGVLNFANVDEIPPNGDTDYNSDGVVGQADQYSHPLNVTIPANSTIKMLQHCMDCRVDAGASSVTSDVGGVLNATDHALTTGYVIYTWPYDRNPLTSAAWLVASFPVMFGPSVTA